MSVSNRPKFRSNVVIWSCSLQKLGPCQRQHCHRAACWSHARRVTEIDVDGLAAARQRVASMTGTSQTLEFHSEKSQESIERVRANFGHPALPALVEARRLGNATVGAIRSARLHKRDVCLVVHSEAQDSQPVGRRIQCVAWTASNEENRREHVRVYQYPFFCGANFKKVSTPTTTRCGESIETIESQSQPVCLYSKLTS